MPGGKISTLGGGDSSAQEYMSGRLLSTAALLGNTALTAPETLILKAGRWLIPDTLNSRAQAVAADRFRIGDEGCDAGNFMLPFTTGQGSGPIRFGGVLTTDTAIGFPCVLQYSGVARILCSNTAAVGDGVIIADGSAAAVNAKGTAIAITPNVNTGVFTVPTASASIGTTATNVYTVVGEVVGPLPAVNGTVAAPQIILVRLYGNPALCQRLVSS